MAMRSVLRRPQERVFRVTLTVHRLDSIPFVHRNFYVHWQVRRAQPSNGRTPTQPIEASHNRVTWNVTNSFSVTIPSEPGDPTLLQSSILSLQLRSERRSRWTRATGASYDVEGGLELDISELAAIGYVSRNYLVEDSPLNITLRLSIRVTHEGGDKIFRAHSDIAASRKYKNRHLKDRPSSSIDTHNQTNVSISDMPASGIADITASAHASASISTASIPVPPNVSTSTLPPIPPTGASASSSVSLQPPDLAPTVEPPKKKFDPWSDPLVGKTTHKVFPYPGGHRFTFGVVCEPVYDPNLDVSFKPKKNADGSVSLLNSIPNPDEVQQEVYEYMWRRRLRETWPEHVVVTRTDPLEDVRNAFDEVCKEDGIVVPGLTRTSRRNSKRPSSSSGQLF